MKKDELSEENYEIWINNTSVFQTVSLSEFSSRFPFVWQIFWQK